MCECIPYLPINCWDIAFFGLYNIAFIVYLETNKATKNVFIRPDSKNRKRISITSYLNFISQPVNFKRPEIAKVFWEPKNLDINYVAVSGIAWFGKTIVSYLCF